ncbi:Alternative oxidase [Afipia felis]|uniref:Alternative oxidase n=1 Tax=Afipia felis TaxID=1035 RepID=A0A090MMY7_AFIFE|nr:MULTISPECIES: alternative oxidase [Afipia]EFI52470.1 Alternative oxidase [Afipia sp. 1NLS2]CEG07034.1 Alternative oxidase [Afipia felis]
MLNIDKTNLLRHHTPERIPDRIAFGLARLVAWMAGNTFFNSRYGDQVIVLETVTAVPPMVVATLLHLKCLRRMLDDGGWVRTFMDEAESQRTHLMAFVALAKPNAWERFLIVLVQGIFYNAYFFLYLISAGTAHRLAAYFAEQAVQGYSKYLSQIESGERAMQPAPALAIAYWALAPDAQVRDMIASMLEDEAIHRDLHHAFADALMQGQTFPDRISSIS